MIRNVRLTEDGLHRIVNESVKRVLGECLGYASPTQINESFSTKLFYGTWDSRIRKDKEKFIRQMKEKHPNVKHLERLVNQRAKQLESEDEEEFQRFIKSRPRPNPWNDLEFDEW